jgi:hypothetical protein
MTITGRATLGAQESPDLLDPGKPIHSGDDDIARATGSV